MTPIVTHVTRISARVVMGLVDGFRKIPVPGVLAQAIFFRMKVHACE
jgi:hypothetical protein